MTVYTAQSASSEWSQQRNYFFLEKMRKQVRAEEKKENSLGALNLYIQISYKHIVLIFLWCLRRWNQQQLRSDSSSFGIKWKEEKSWQFLKNAFNDKIIWSKAKHVCLFFALSLSPSHFLGPISRFPGENSFRIRRTEDFSWSNSAKSLSEQSEKLSGQKLNFN